MRHYLFAALAVCLFCAVEAQANSPVRGPRDYFWCPHQAAATVAPYPYFAVPYAPAPMPCQVAPPAVDHSRRAPAEGPHRRRGSHRVRTHGRWGR